MASTSAGRAGYLPGLDSLRSIAVIAVVLFHLDFAFIPGGFFGVSLFFTVSGFLIARNFMVEIDSGGGVSLREFWSRRARRLFPAAWFVLGAIALSSALWPRLGRGIGFNGKDVLAALANVANWRFLYSGSSYASLFKAPSAVLHFWSLAIEEQAYVIVALIVAIGAWKFRHGSAKILGFVALGLAMLSWALPLVASMTVTRTYYGTDTRIGEILAGVALACWRHRTSVAVNNRLPQWAWTLGALAGFIIIVHATNPSSPGLAKGLLPLVSLTSCALILVATSAGSPMARLGAVPVVAGLGRLSYIVYLVHWPLILVLRWQDVSLNSVKTVVGLGVVIGVVAWLIAKFVEHPVRSRVWGRSTVGAAAAVTVAVIIAATTFGAPAPTAADKTLTALEDAVTTFGRGTLPDAATSTTTVATTGSTVPTGSTIAVSTATGQTGSETTSVVATTATAAPTTAVTSPLTVRALGDSIMISLAIATPVGNPDLAYVEGPDDLGVGCGVTDFGNDTHATKCGDRPAEWAAATPTAPASEAEAAVVMSCQWESIDRNIPNTKGTSHVGQDAFNAYVAKSYTKTIYELLASGVPKVLWVRCPYPSQTVGIDDVGLDVKASRDPARTDALNLLITNAVAAFPGRACVVPFDEWMNQRTDDATLRPDGEHYATDTGGAAAIEFAKEVGAAYDGCR